MSLAFSDSISFQKVLSEYLDNENPQYLVIRVDVEVPSYYLSVEENDPQTAKNRRMFGSLTQDETANFDFIYKNDPFFNRSNRNWISHPINQSGLIDYSSESDPTGYGGLKNRNLEMRTVESKLLVCDLNRMEQFFETFYTFLDPIQFLDHIPLIFIDKDFNNWMDEVKKSVAQDKILSEMWPKLKNMQLETLLSDFTSKIENFHHEVTTELQAVKSLFSLFVDSEHTDKYQIISILADHENKWISRQKLIDLWAEETSSRRKIALSSSLKECRTRFKVIEDDLLTEPNVRMQKTSPDNNGKGGRPIVKYKFVTSVTINNLN